MKSCRSCWLYNAILGMVLLTPVTTANYIQSDDTDPQAVVGPIISSMNENKEIILQNGQNYTLTCKGKRPILIKQQNIPEEVVGMFHKELRDVIPTDNENPYEIALDLYNVDQYAVGYYACFDDTVNSKALLGDIMEEPTDTQHVSFTYVYVNGTDVLFAPMSEFGTLINGSKVILQCRPTMPDIEMTLSVPQTDKTPEILKFSPKIGFLVRKQKHSYRCNGRRGYETSWKLILQENTNTPEIKIDQGSDYFLEGETFTLNCSVEYQPNSPIALDWEKPRNYTKDTDKIDTNEQHGQPGRDVYYAITIENASIDDAGIYTCILKNLQKKTIRRPAEKKYLEKPFIILKKTNSDEKIESKVKNPRLKVEVKAYPSPTFSFLRDNERLIIDNIKYKKTISNYTGDVSLMICNSTVSDTANYTIVASNGYVTDRVTYDFRRIENPVVKIIHEGDIIYLENTQKSLRCEATGYPLPNIEWIFSTDKNDEALNGDGKRKSEYKVVSDINLVTNSSGNVTCKATNKAKSVSDTRQILLYEIEQGFGIVEKETWYPENHKVAFKCLASIYEYSNLTWRGANGDELNENVKYYQSPFSHVAKLKIERISLSQAGLYTCVGYKFNGSEEHENINIEVEATRPPIIIEPEMDKDEVVRIAKNVKFSCIADAVPLPEITWLKEGFTLKNETEGVQIFNYMNHTVVNSTIVITTMEDVNKGKYECLAKSGGKTTIKYLNLVVKEPEFMQYKGTVLAAIAAVILALIALVMYLTWKIRKEKQFRKELAAAGLLYFKEGVAKSLNPDLGIDEQAELLPYDEKFEFPPEKLILGKQLGAGAFGVVYKADARGIINAEETTPVAVKMVKKTADNMYIKALASELKIMVHLGKHVNIVNLLGACTKNVGKRELIVIVEYCKFGNIHNYMQKHREVFIDQLTDNKEKNLGRVNRGYSASSGSSGMNSDYFGLNHTQGTDNTFLNTANSNKSGRKDKQNQQEEFVKVSETGYIQPEWRSNYESDYSFSGRQLRPLSSRDLLAWAFQIARGMEYLASRKVLHGDLAARNVLLAEDNIVKICDFGLARSIYKNDEYQKKENSPLPVKWLAIECMMDRIFSTQSDIWSFGIVLWEMFSLAKTPYPNMSPQHLLQWLSEGHRLEKPTYADDRLYDVMLRCWSHKPNARPSFSQLQELLGSFLEDNVRNHYVDLNSAYMDMNVKTEGEDYLAMVSAPDYNNLVTPSPHHYVNDADARSFFPPSSTQVPLDEDGYLQMTTVNPSIFSPRIQTTKFDFDTKKMDSRVAEGRGGSELTPMLTLNNLPAKSGSESDHEGGQSPYLKMCPIIAEESDDVFKPNQNNTMNTHNSAVTNLTYISLGMDVEKKPQDINNYINIPNGLVK